MALKLPENSLFAILLRARWWVSILVAAGVFAVARLFAQPAVAAFFALPFLAIGVYAASRQIRRPSAKRIASTLQRAREMPWEEFRAALEAGFRREGFTTQSMDGGADLELRQGGLVTLVACKRWKAARTGVEALREFEVATGEAHARMYLAVGEVTDTARKFAAEKRIQLLDEEDLARLLR